jgi:ferric-dicitrate binding protein FerR (iron transport regulator)
MNEIPFDLPRPNDSRPPAHLIERYAAGECTLAERVAMDRWIAANPSLGQALRAMGLDGEFEAGLVGGGIPQGMRMPDADGVRHESGANTKRISRRALWGRPTLPKTLYTICAAAAIVFGMVVLSRGENRRSSFGHVLPRMYTTTSGQYATVTLTDGSRVLLGPATTLSVAIQPGDESVDARVVGQARFIVTHNKDRTFRVHVGHAVARVLGTTFLVRRYETDHTTRVVVTDGRVSLASVRHDARGATLVGNGAVLTTGMLGTVPDTGMVQVTPDIAVDDYTGWTRGQLVFRDTPARDVVTELGRAYGVEIHIADSARAVRPLSWTISLSERSLTDVLESLVDVLDAHPVRTGSIITFFPGRSASHRPMNPRSLSSSERTYGK